MPALLLLLLTAIAVTALLAAVTGIGLPPHRERPAIHLPAAVTYTHPSASTPQILLIRSRAEHVLRAEAPAR
ncbi:hypothetical protein FXF51_31115 [Nonomuraea sp. PA05]|uniref:hypothetical protein n=1 Tax=Nonomuraea sp. PA05 TaxID=2604466 RepID=UPI0011D98691|nr:hypothetical protein [Nonomuraea sp. PA05]TYB60660.1 hypothetical protein FXF51_31115 [Nonomuraea sp. PA05]